MAYENFGEVLMGLRRQKAAVGGRSPTESEVSGIVSGYASAAEERLYDAESLRLTQEMHKEDLGQQKKEFEESSEMSKGQFAEELGFQEKKWTEGYELQKQSAEEEASQFAETLATRKSEYASTLAESKFQFEEELAFSMSSHDDSMSLANKEYASSLVQFNETMDENQRQFDETIAESQSQFDEEMGLAWETFYAEKDAASSALKAQRGSNITTGALGGGLIGGMLYGAETGALSGNPYAVVGGIVIGGIIGAFGGDASWICTETDKQIGLSMETLQSLNRFRSYAWDNHKRIMVYYLRTAPQLIGNINKKLGEGAKKVFENFKNSVLYPVTVATDSCHIEDAFQLYKNKALELVKEYLPEQTEKLESLIVKDDIRFLNLAT